MRSKIILHVLVILFFLVISAYAQEITSVNDVVAKMKKEFNLTPQQVNAVKPVIEESAAKREELRQSVQEQSMIIDRATIQNKIGQLNQDENQKLSQILTQDQMHKWIQKQRLRNAFNQDQMDNTRWGSEDDRQSRGKFLGLYSTSDSEASDYLELIVSPEYNYIQYLHLADKL